MRSAGRWSFNQGEGEGAISASFWFLTEDWRGREKKYEDLS